MPTVIGRHDISKDKDHWLSSPKQAEVFGALGVTNIRTFVNPDSPTQVAVLMDVPDMDALMAAYRVTRPRRLWLTTASCPRASSSSSRSSPRVSAHQLEVSRDVPIGAPS